MAAGARAFVLLQHLLPKRLLTAAVYRLARLSERLSERSALVMLAAWRGSVMAVARAKYRPALYDDERQRARAATGQARPAVQPGSDPATRTGTDGSRR